MSTALRYLVFKAKPYLCSEKFGKVVGNHEKISANGHQQLGQTHEGFGAFARALIWSPRITALKRKLLPEKLPDYFHVGDPS